MATSTSLPAKESRALTKAKRHAPLTSPRIARRLAKPLAVMLTEQQKH